MHLSVLKIQLSCVTFLLCFCGTILLFKAKGLCGIAVTDFNVNDIWNQKLMPMEIFSKHYIQVFLQNMPRNTSAILHFRSKGKAPFASNMSDFNAALNEMVFHRQKINEFLATDYVVQSMLREWNARDDRIPIAKRKGVLHNESLSSHHKLLNDEGMTKYRSWVERSVTLDDIRRHLPYNNNLKGTFRSADVLDGNRKQTFNDEITENNEEEDFDDGDITGYALNNNYNNPYNTQSDINAQYWPFSPMPTANVQLNNRAMNKNGYESGYDDYGSNVHGHPHPTQLEAQQQNKEITIKDITDIALTTLAFLSFGMFILQILMCITMGKDDSSSMTMLPMEINDNDLPGGGTEEIRRKRRSTMVQDEKLKKMNELARRVIFSIDSVLLLPQDEGNCHYWALCENNKFAKSQTTGQQFWIPIWSMGVSWLTSRVQETTKNNGNYGAVLKSLKAIIIGISNGDCDGIYKKHCENHSKVKKES